MLLRALDWILSRTLRSVPFGIVLLVLIAAYIAVGSGFPGVREYFETDELAFFNAWPLKLLMVLMVATLITVTLERIPLTPPRYGVWLVHIGIVVLVGGVGWYYANKREGSLWLHINEAKATYYDRWDRSLYARVDGLASRAKLPSLPRFHEYDQTLNNADYLNKKDLRNVTPIFMTAGGANVQTLGEQIGVPDLRLDVTGYWPYADVLQRLVHDPSGQDVGFSLQLPDERDNSARNFVMIGGQMRYQRFGWQNVQFEHRPVQSQAEIDAVVGAAHQLHRLDIELGGYKQTLFVDPGQTYKLGDTGYSIRIESFRPDWVTIDKKTTQLLTMIVQSPKQVFRRQVLVGVPQPTDWILNAPGSGPMGKRQKAPLDPALKMTYTFADPQNLLPAQALGRYLFFTLPGSQQTTVVGILRNDPHSVQTFTGNGTLSIQPPTSEEELLAASHAGHDHGPLSVPVERVEGARVEQYVQSVPKARRNRDEGKEGTRQVLRVHASATTRDGKPWQEDIFVPTSQFPLELPWQGGLLEVPGASKLAQLQLGAEVLPLPARVKLDKLAAEPYAGMELSAASAIRDYRSTITITNPATQETRTDTVYLNSPVFYQNNNWIFFQSGYDTQEQRWTILGVGNRPGTYTMAAGCGLIIVGIFYAFYIKPIIIKSMKKRALAKAAQEPRPAKPKRERAVALTAENVQ